MWLKCDHDPTRTNVTRMLFNLRFRYRSQDRLLSWIPEKERHPRIIFCSSVFHGYLTLEMDRKKSVTWSSWLLRFIHPWRLTWNLTMKVWKMVFLVKQVIFRFHVNFPGWKREISENSTQRFGTLHEVWDFPHTRNITFPQMDHASWTY